MSFLLDTSVISELVKPTPDNNVVEWIAATGIAHDLIIATRNIGDFERCGASCFNP